MGLSVGVLIQEQIANAQVTIYAEAVTPNTTGDIAAGLWGPYASNEDPRILTWSKATYDYLYSLLRHPEQNKIGVSLLHGYKYDGGKTAEPMPYWGHIPYGMRRMTAEELSLYPAASGGWSYYAPTCEGKRYNAWIMAKFQANGGSIIMRKINSFSELANEQYNCIINCPGLGAKELCNDNEMYPIRGQVRRVRAPWVTWFVMLDNEKGSTYIIPNSESIVLGGTTQKDDWNQELREADLEHILRGTSEVVPSLKQAELIRDQVGLRPGRTSVRLELETMKIDGKDLKVIHNYGHGGSGYTLFYGCAQEVLKILTGLLNRA